MKKYHVISAKRMGWETIYDYHFFPVDEFTKEDALAQFRPVQNETMKNNGNWYPYTAYEYDGQTYHSIIYSGIEDEDKIREG